MSAVGEDIWTANAVKTIKAYTCDNIWRILAPELDGLSLYDPSTATEKIKAEKNHSEDESEKQPEQEERSEESSDLEKDSDEQPNGVDEAQTKKESEEEEATPAEEPAAATPETHNSSSSPPSTPAPTQADPVTVQKNITRDWIYQLLFDALYLDEVLHRRRRRGHNGVGSVASLAAKVDDTLGRVWQVEEKDRKRLEGAASEHWKKTGLLFGLLNS